MYLIEPTVTGCHMCWIVMKSLFVHFILFYFFFETYFILVIESDHIIKGVRFIN